MAKQGIFPSTIFPRTIFPVSIFPYLDDFIVPIPTVEGLPMPFADYGQLQASLLSWIHREKDKKVIAAMPDFIRLAEVKLNRTLKMRLAEVETTLTATVGSRYLPLPLNYGTPIALWLEAVSPRVSLTFRPVTQQRYVNTPTTPKLWALDGARVVLDRPAAAQYPFTFRYLSWFQLTTDSPTNWLLTNYPDCYLYGALLQIIGFAGGTDDKRLAIWNQLYKEALAEVDMVEQRQKTLATLGTDLPHQGGRHFLSR